MPVQPLGGFSVEQVGEEPLTTWRCRSPLTMSSRSSVFALTVRETERILSFFVFVSARTNEEVTFTVYQTNYSRFAFHMASQCEILLVTRHCLCCVTVSRW